MTSRKHVVALAMVLLFCFATRVGWVLHVSSAHPEAVVSADSPSYVDSARSIARTGAFTRRPGSDAPMFVRTPGYPSIIATVLLFDEDTTTFLVIQATLSCFIVLLAFWIARRMWGPTVGVVAAALLALEPLQFAASGTLLTESLFSLVLLGVVAVGFRIFGREHVEARWCAVLGALIAFATLIRPTTYYLPACVLVFLVVAFRHLRWRTITAASAAFLVPIIALVGGWQLRNQVEAGTWRYSGIDAVNMYWYYAADAVARDKGVSTDAARDELAHQLAKSPLARCGVRVDPVGSCTAADASHPGPYYDLLFRRGLEIVRSHPVETTAGIGAALIRELFGPGTSTVARFLTAPASTALSLALASYLALFYASFLVGVVILVRSRTRLVAHAFALMCAIYVLVVSVGPASYARFRGPTMPILALYAALGLTTVGNRLHRRAQQSHAAR